MPSKKKLKSQKKKKAQNQQKVVITNTNKTTDQTKKVKKSKSNSKNKTLKIVISEPKSAVNDKPNVKTQKSTKEQKISNKKKPKNTNYKSIAVNTSKIMKFVQPNRNSPYSKGLKKKMGYKRMNFYDLSNPNVFTLSKAKEIGDKVIQNEYKNFMNEIFTMIKDSKLKKLILNNKLDTMFKSITQLPYRIGKLSINPFSDTDFAIEYSAQLKSKPNVFKPLFHLTFHGTDAISTAEIKQSKQGHVFKNTGSIHIVADDKIVSAIDGLKFEKESKKGKNQKPLIVIDDSNLVYNENAKIKFKELLARIQLGVVNHNNKSYFQIISMNYSPKLNPIFLKEIMKIVFVFNHLILSTPFSFPVMIDDLSIKNNSWINMERESKDVTGFGDESFLKTLSKKFQSYFQNVQIQDNLSIDSDVDDYDSDVEYMDPFFV